MFGHPMRVWITLGILLIIALILIMRNFSKDDAGTFQRLGMINNYSASW
jgi:hypothetical protein